MSSSFSKRLAIACATALTVGACYQGDATPDAGDAAFPFQADTPFVYVAKVKNVLTGLAPSQAEVDQVASAPDDASKRAALVSLIDTWMTLPEYRTKLLSFFQVAFQQTQISTADFAELVPNGGNLGYSGLMNLLVENARESFARTMLELIDEGQPFTAAFTTSRFMMTAPLMELYGLLDSNQVNDDDKVVLDRYAKKGQTVVVEDLTPVDLETETLVPTSPNYMHWYYPNLAALPPTPPSPSTGCQVDERDYASPELNGMSHLLHDLLYGELDIYLVSGQTPPTCTQSPGIGANSHFKYTTPQNDFNTWKLVNIRQPNGTEAPTPFFDPAQLRVATELVLQIPRVGFFSTPAFHANWQTNTSNQMRVTINQAFIVALGAQVDGTDPTTLPGGPIPALDQTHASQPACVGCHQYLDPSRAIFQATYTNGYGPQTNAALTSQKGWFAFRGLIDQSLGSIGDFGSDLAKHPLVAEAWAQKLCFYVNSHACDPTDPEFQSIVADFQNGFQWKKLVEDLLSSPITTNAVTTVTAQNTGELVSVSRVLHLCSLLSGRLQLVDPCQLDVVSNKAPKGIPEIAAGLPSDGYGRGAPIPVLPTLPTLFYRGALENICGDVADEIVDTAKPPANAITYSSATSDAAIADFVLRVMGIVPDDPRSSVMVQKLTAHYQNALSTQASPTDSLKSTFILACMSPTVAGIGM